MSTATSQAGLRRAPTDHILFRQYSSEMRLKCKYDVTLSLLGQQWSPSLDDTVGVCETNVSLMPPKSYL